MEDQNGAPASGPTSPLDIELGPYRILDRIGAGGMGEVFRGTDTRLSRPVAVKFLFLKMADERARLRFQQEARMASALNHPHILTVYEAGESKGRQYLVTEFVDGGTLRNWALSAKPTWRQTLELLVGVADGLACAHEAGILHRDIKPENILVTRSGYAKLGDFGLAKLLDTESADQDQTRTLATTNPGMVVGTIAYMSPEQASGKPLDQRSDIYSFGVLLYELLARRRPFDGASDLELIQTIIHRTGPPPELSAEIPVGLRIAVAKALEKDPAERYQSMRDLVVDLRRLVRQSGESAVPVTVQRAKRRWPLPASLAAVLLLVSALAWYLLGMRSGIDSIAVLPFSNVAQDVDLENQADGLTEELINNLTQVPNLKVKGRATVFRFKGKDLDPQAIGKQLEVRVILMGKVVRNGERISVQADLVDAGDGSQLWGKQYNLDSEGMQTIPGEIAQQVVGKINIDQREKRPAQRRITNPQAYELYLQGRRAISDVTEERLRQSGVYFQQAISRDPSFAAAWAGLADFYSYLAFLELEAPKDVMPKAKEAALKALELDSETAEAYTSLGIVQSVWEWDWVGAEKRFQRAIELNPGGAYDQHWYGHCLEWLGRWREALIQLQKAQMLDPLNPMPTECLGYDSLVNHRYEDALRYLRQVVELDPKEPVGRGFLALALEAKGLRRESLAENDRARDCLGGVTIIAGTIAGIYCRLGKPEEARKMLVDLDARSKRRYVSPLEQAAIHIALGEKDEGFRLLNAALEDRSVNLQYNVTDPVFDSVRSDPRLAAIRTKLGLPETAWAVNVLSR